MHPRSISGMLHHVVLPCSINPASIKNETGRFMFIKAVSALVTDLPDREMDCDLPLLHNQQRLQEIYPVMLHLLCQQQMLTHCTP